MHNIEGYISEKILHCFKVGCVPVYWGASNVTDYIPENCFIDRRKFSSELELYNFLKDMSQSKYEEYIKNIRLFTQSPSINLYSWNTFINTFVNALP